MWQVFRFDPQTCEVEDLSAVNAITCEGNRATSCACSDCDQGVCSACPEGAECDPTTGACDDPCADVSCESGSICNSEDGNCVSVQCAPCEDESDCPDDSYCVIYTTRNVRACGVVCEEDDDCGSGQTCSRIFREGRRVNVCTDLENACQVQLCENITCDMDTVCDPSDGTCVECVNNEQCGDDEACVDQICVETTGQDRPYSDWGDGNVLPSCDQCTDDENCQEPFALVDDFCALPCDETLVCPEGLSCCDVSRVGLMGSICVDPRNQIANRVCGG
jgi:hypothetical protein